MYQWSPFSAPLFQRKGTLNFSWLKLQLAPRTLQSRVCVEVGQTNVLLPVYRTLEMSPGLGLRLGVRWEMGGEGGACPGSPVGSRTRQAGLQFQLHRCQRSLDLCEYPLLWLGKRATASMKTNEEVVSNREAKCSEESLPLPPKTAHNLYYLDMQSPSKG